MRACELGWHSFAYFSVAIDRKVSRHKGETEYEKAFLTRKKNNTNGSTTHAFYFDLIPHEKPTNLWHTKGNNNND